MDKTKALTSILFAAGFFSVAFAGVKASPANITGAGRPARSVRIGAKTAATATAANTEIVLAPGASRTTRFAAKELQSFLSQILGGKIPVVHQTAKDKVSFILGISAWSEKAGVDSAKLVRDAFIIKTADNRVYIAGRDDPEADPERAINRGGVWAQLYERGTLFGVYDFLERVGGVRMYFPGELGTIVPKKTALAIPELDIYDRPDFIQRRVSTFSDGVYFEGKNPTAILNPAKILNSYYRLRLETRFIPCCHGTNGFHYIKRFGRSHPEYFALLGNGKRSNDPNDHSHHPGQLCWTSGIVEELYRDVRSYLKGEDASVRQIPGRHGGCEWHIMNCREGKFVDIMPQDGFTGCRCPRCQAAYKKGQEDYASELIWGVTAAIAKRLKKEGVHGYVTQMAYPPYRRIPSFAIPDNVLVMAAESGPWGKMNPAQQAKDDQEIKGWAKKLGRKVWIWTYPNKWGGLAMPGIPQMSPRAYGEYYQRLSPYIFGAFAESESDRFLYNYLNYYIFAKVAWDNRADWRKLLDEHYRLMFGKAAEVMKKYYETLENIWVGKIAGRIVDTALGPATSPPSDYDLWHKIYTPEVLAEMDRELDQAASLAGADSLEAKRIALIRREFQEPLKQTAEQYRKQTDAVRGVKLHITGAPGKELYLRPSHGKNDMPALETVKTAVQVWRTADKLGVKFTCEEPRMAESFAVRRRTDDPEIWKDNSVEIFLNPDGDRKTYYQLMINSAGSLSDQKLVKSGAGGKGAYAWNSGAEVRVEKQDKAWTAEVLIPLRNLPGLKEEFPANFARSRILKQSGKHHVLYQWSPFARGFHDLENFGSLTTAKDTDILLNGDFALPAQRSAFHFGVWEGSKWRGGWIGVKDHTVTDRKVFLSPPYSVRIKGCDKRINLRQYLPALKPGRKYRLSFYVKLQAVKPLKKGGGFVGNIWDDKNRWFPAHNSLTGTMDWTFQSFEFVAGKNTNVNCRSYIGLVLANASGDAWVDEVKLEEIK